MLTSYKYGGSASARTSEWIQYAFRYSVPSDILALLVAHAKSIVQTKLRLAYRIASEKQPMAVSRVLEKIAKRSDKRDRRLRLLGTIPMWLS